jgi:hypothetical protein
LSSGAREQSYQYSVLWSWPALVSGLVQWPGADGPLAFSELTAEGIEAAVRGFDAQVPHHESKSGERLPTSAASVALSIDCGDFDAGLLNQIRWHLKSAGFPHPNALYTAVAAENDLYEDVNDAWPSNAALRARHETIAGTSPVSLQGISILGIWEARYAVKRQTFDMDNPNAAISAFFSELAGDSVALQAATPSTPPDIPDDELPAADSEQEPYVYRGVEPVVEDSKQIHFDTNDEFNPAENSAAGAAHGHIGPHRYSGYSYRPQVAYDPGTAPPPSATKDPGGGGMLQKMLHWAQRHPFITSVSFGAVTLLLALIVARSPGPGGRPD